MECVETGNYEKLDKALKLVTHRKLDKDKFCRMLSVAYKSDYITRREYHDLFNDLEKYLKYFLNDRELNNVLKRTDWRTLGEFALTIYDNTRREKVLADSWVEMCKTEGLLKEALLQNNGMANNGQVVFTLSSVNHEADYRITLTESQIEIPDGHHKLEVKYCPSSKFLTYKAQDLEAYVRSKAYALTIMGENRMLGANGNPDVDDSFDVNDLGLSWWAIMTPAIMHKMLHELPVRIYQGYMGNKPCVRLYKEDSPRFEDFFKVKKWPI